MDTASTYFTRRARQERTKATEAASAEARSAHLELALRLVSVATQPALWSGWSASVPDDRDAAHRPATEGTSDLGNALASAFPLPARGTFEDLLKAVDEPRRGSHHGWDGGPLLASTCVERS
jgi:hypothetical protein